MVPLQMVIHDGRTYEAKKKKGIQKAFWKSCPQKIKKNLKSSPQNLPSLITELFSKSSQRQRNLPKIPAESSNKLR